MQDNTKILDAGLRIGFTTTDSDDFVAAATSAAKGFIDTIKSERPDETFSVFLMIQPKEGGDSKAA